MNPLDDAALDALAPPTIPNINEIEDGQAALRLEDWRAQDIDEASWLGRRLARARGRIAQVRAIAEAQTARIAEWERAEEERWAQDVTFFEQRLAAFHAQVLEDDPKAKTIRLPDGTILRSAAGRLAVDVEDLDALIAWCEANERDDLLRVREPEADKTAIAQACGAKAGDEEGEYPAADENGEVVPGVKIVRRPRSYTADTESDETR